jgi:flavin-dependent thymidylate synthase
MTVTLKSFTPNALELLLGTKNTRLGFKEDPQGWSDEKKSEHLSYMRDTIKSSWEFVDYVFEITQVTRAFTHQLVRTRTGSYAQESQRTVDVRDSLVMMPEAVALNEGVRPIWVKAIELSKSTYKYGVDVAKIPVQDMRGILPTNMLTSITAKFSLRTLHEMAKLRLCTRTQGEYQDVFREMRQRVLEVHPWVGEYRFLEVHCVGEGTCAFPRYGKKECRFYRPWMDRSAEQDELHDQFWSAEQQVAVPVAQDGKTM